MTAPLMTPQPVPVPAINPAPVLRPRPSRLPTAAGLRDVPAPPPHVGHPLLAISAQLAAASLLDASDVSAWWVFAGTAIAGIAVPAVAHQRFSVPGWKDHETGAYHDGVARPEIGFSFLTAVATGGWLTWTTATTPWSMAPIATLLIGSSALGAGYGTLRWRRDKRNRKQVETRAVAREQAKRQIWEQVLTKAGAKGITVGATESFHAGISMPLTLGENSPDYNGLVGCIPSIERIAARITGLPIRSGSIQIQRGKFAHEAVMIVPTRDVLNEVIELPDLHGPRSVTEPMVTGQYVDGNEVQVTFRGFHGMFAGMTNFGKSALLDAHMTQLTRCTDNVTFCLAGNKAVRWLRPWLKPWLQGAAAVPPIDWVAGDIDEALLVLADIYRAIDGRQAMPNNGDTGWEPTPENPQITILVDESTDLLESTKTITTHKGEKKDFSDLLLTIVRTARSEAIQVIFCAQRGTATLLGGNGGDLKSQVLYRAGFRATGNMTDVNAVFSTNTTGIELSELPKGAWYVELEDDHRPKLAKGYWTTPARISEYAIEATAYVGGVDAPTAELMEHYTGRWSRPGQLAFLEKVNGGSLRPELLDILTAGAPATASTAVTNAGPSSEDMPDVYAAAGDYDASDVMARIKAWADQKENEQDTTADVKLLEQLWDQPEISENARNIGPVALPTDTLDLLAALHASGVLYASEEEWIPAADIRALAAHELDWPENTEGNRRIVAALAALGVESKRVTKKKITAYPVDELKAAAARHKPTSQ